MLRLDDEPAGFRRLGLLVYVSWVVELVLLVLVRRFSLAYV